MTSPEPSNMTRLEYGFNSDLFDRVSAITALRELSLGDSIRNGFGMLNAWDRLKAIGEQIVVNTGLTVGTANEKISDIHISSLGRIAALVELEKQSYETVDTTQSLYVTDDFRLKVDLYSLSRGYPSRDSAFRDAALFFCNLHEIIQQKSE